EPITRSAIKTGKALVVHEAPITGGFGGEVVAQLVASEAFDYLDAPVRRLAGLDVPIPYNRELERRAVPQVEDIVREARALVREGDVVPVTTVIAFVVQAGERLPDELPAPTTKSPTAPSIRRATPLARRYAAVAGVDIDQVPASQPAGRITRQDVERYLAQLGAVQRESTADAGRPRATPAARRLARQYKVD